MSGAHYTGKYGGGQAPAKRAMVERFTIQCTTCRARLSVNDPSVIGAILACPKGSSMVQVVPPVGWSRDEEAAAPPASASSSTGAPKATSRPAVKPAAKSAPASSVANSSVIKASAKPQPARP